MEQSFLSLFTTSFFVFALVIAIIIIIIRNIVEAIFRKLSLVIPDKIENILLDFWREWVLRGLPIILGGVIALYASQYPFPEEFAASESGRIFIGIIAGLFSSTVYSFTKFHAKKYIPKQIKEKLNNINPLSNKENL